MKKNMGKVDRIIRPSLAAAIVTLVATDTVKGPITKALLGLSVIFLATSAVGWCPAYAALNIDTLPDNEKAGI